MQKQPFLVVVGDDRGIAFWGIVDVAVVANGPDGLHGVASHTGHGDGGQAVPHVVFEDVLPLAMEQKNHGLGREHRLLSGFGKWGGWEHTENRFWVSVDRSLFIMMLAFRSQNLVSFR